MLRLESDLFFEFQSRLNNEKREYESAWDLLFLMRHYGIPTRTLDWTETLGVAIYFAITGKSPSTPARIWILNPYELNVKTWGPMRDTVLPKYLASPKISDPNKDYDDILGYWEHDKLEFKGPVAICPSRANSRMQAQAGSFTVHGTDWRSINAQFSDDVVRSVEISIDACEGAKLFLREAGLTTRVLFPGLDGLAKEMNERFSA